MGNTFTQQETQAASSQKFHEKKKAQQRFDWAITAFPILYVSEEAEEDEVASA